MTTAKPGRSPTRRNVLVRAAAAGVAVSVMPRFAIAKARTPIKLAWLSGAVCVAPVPLAQTLGLYEKHGLDVELIKHEFHTPEFLASPTNGQADAAVTMLHNWLRVINTGSSVKFLAGIHGGCIRLCGSKAAGATSLQALRGKTIGLAAEPGPLAKTVYSILLWKQGIDPEKDVTWKQVPGKELGNAIRAGDVQAIGELDPLMYMMMKANPDLVEVTTNQSGPFKGTVCCVAAAGPSLWRDNPSAARALAKALNEASDYAAAHPMEAAKEFASQTMFNQEDLMNCEHMLDLKAHNTGVHLRRDVALFVDGFKAIGLMDKSIDSKDFARKTVVDFA